MRAFVTELPLGEPARFNPEQLEKLCNTMGEIGAEAEVAQALDRISKNLATLQNASSSDHPGMEREAIEKLETDASLIGMATLARVARSVLDCAEAGDDVAFHATLARLDRVGDRSIQAVWDLDDLSG